MLEQELKLMLNEQQYNQLLQYRINSVTFVNHYFVTKQLDSAFMARIRHYDDSYTLTKKSRVSRDNDVFVSYEHNYELKQEQALRVIKHGLSAETATKLFGEESGKYVYIGKARTTRAVLDINGYLMEVDKVDYLGTTDYEIECESDDTDSFVAVRQLLSDLIGDTTSSKPKSERFLELLKRKNNEV